MISDFGKAWWQLGKLATHPLQGKKAEPETFARISNLRCRHCDRFALICGHCGKTFGIQSPKKRKTRLTCPHCRQKNQIDV
ncbi:MAG: hypothetical protein QNK37_30660 [Acidobacteriota bacterium]|nr:hypothetical protein [Acidobacteriota bacterium]